MDWSERRERLDGVHLLSMESSFGSWMRIRIRDSSLVRYKYCRVESSKRMEKIEQERARQRQRKMSEHEIFKDRL